MKSSDVRLKLNAYLQLIITPDGETEHNVTRVFVDNSGPYMHSITFECEDGESISIDYFPNRFP